jgi:hypothetical protein
MALSNSAKKKNGFLLPSELIIKILQGKISESRIDYHVKGGKYGRGRKTLAPSPLRNFNRPYLVYRLAIYSRLCQSGLVGDFACLNNLAVLSGASTGLIEWGSVQ